MYGALLQVGFSALSGFLGKKAEADRIEDINKQKIEQFEENRMITAEMLSTAIERTDRAVDEANRHAIKQKMAIENARHYAEGEATVRAAHLGTGSGTRASLQTFVPAARMAANEVSDVNINLETEFINITEHFNDTATKMIQNLNNSAPYLDEPPSTMDMLMSAGAAGLNAYGSLSDVGKANFKGVFKGWNLGGSGYTPASFDGEYTAGMVTPFGGR